MSLYTITKIVSFCCRSSPREPLGTGFSDTHQSSSSCGSSPCPRLDTARAPSPGKVGGSLMFQNLCLAEELRAEHVVKILALVLPTTTPSIWSPLLPPPVLLSLLRHRLHSHSAHIQTSLATDRRGKNPTHAASRSGLCDKSSNAARRHNLHAGVDTHNYVIPVVSFSSPTVLSPTRPVNIRRLELQPDEVPATLERHVLLAEVALLKILCRFLDFVASTSRCPCGQHDSKTLGCLQRPSIPFMLRWPTF